MQKQESKIENRERIEKRETRGFSVKQAGLTMLELVVASGISGIFFLTAFLAVNHLLYSQSQVEVSQNFYHETRILTDRLSLLMRNNTIDYDRFWSDRMLGGPDPDPLSCLAYLQNTKNFSRLPEDQLSLIQYEDVFYFDNNDLDEVGDEVVLDTFRGGVDLNGFENICAKALEGPQTHLYLLNRAQTLQTTIVFDEDQETISVEKSLGIDTNNDGYIDTWGNAPRFENGFCQLQASNGDWQTIIGDRTSLPFCSQAHPPTVIHPPYLGIEDLSFEISPDRDPFLNFANPDTQKHPLVFFHIQTTLNAGAQYGFTPDTQPHLSLQTAVSSRVFGDPRPPHDIYRFCENSGCQ